MKPLLFRLKQLRREKSARLYKNITMRDVCQETGIALSTLNRLENNLAQGVELTTLQRLAAFYEVTVGELFTDNPEEGNNLPLRLAA